jgi:hypothetical protein
MCLVVEISHYFFTSLFLILLVGEVGGLLFLPINHFTIIHFTVLFHYVFLWVSYVGPPGDSEFVGRFPVGFFVGFFRCWLVKFQFALCTCKVGCGEMRKICWFCFYLHLL